MEQKRSWNTKEVTIPKYSLHPIRLCGIDGSIERESSKSSFQRTNRLIQTNMAIKPIEEQQLTKKYLEIFKKMALNFIMLMQNCMFIRCLSKNSYFFVVKFSLIVHIQIFYFKLSFTTVFTELS